jgi:hypothetical protein
MTNDPVRPDTYDEAAGIILDLLHAYGQSHLVRVTDVKQMRSALRREARHRGVTHRTHLLGSDQVLVYTNDPSPEAQADGERRLRKALDAHSLSLTHAMHGVRALPTTKPLPPWTVDMGAARVLGLVRSNVAPS